MTNPDPTEPADLTPEFVTIPLIVYDALTTIAERHSAIGTVVLQVLDDHHATPDRYGLWCSCGYDPDTIHAWHQHVADHITDQLQQTPPPGPTHPPTPCPAQPPPPHPSPHPYPQENQ